MWCVPCKESLCKCKQAGVMGGKHTTANFSSTLCVLFFFVSVWEGGWMATRLLLLLLFFYLSRSLSLSLSLSLLWLRTGDCPLAMEWWEMGGDALAGLEEEVVEEELLVERSRPPPPPPPPPVAVPLCLMPLSSMLWALPPVTSFHSCCSSAGLRPAADRESWGEETCKLLCLVLRWRLKSNTKCKNKRGTLRIAMCLHHSVLLYWRPNLAVVLYRSIKKQLCNSSVTSWIPYRWQIALVFPRLSDFCF